MSLLYRLKFTFYAFVKHSKWFAVVALGEEPRGPQCPLVLDNNRRNHRSKSQQGKKNKTTLSLTLPPLSLRSGSATAMHVILHTANIPYSVNKCFFSTVVIFRKMLCASILSVLYSDFAFQAFQEDWYLRNLRQGRFTLWITNYYSHNYIKKCRKLERSK